MVNNVLNQKKHTHHDTHLVKFPNAREELGTSDPLLLLVGGPSDYTCALVISVFKEQWLLPARCVPLLGDGLLLHRKLLGYHSLPGVRHPRTHCVQSPVITGISGLLNKAIHSINLCFNAGHTSLPIIDLYLHQQLMGNTYIIC